MRGCHLKINSDDVRHRILARDAGGHLNLVNGIAQLHYLTKLHGPALLGYGAEPPKVASAEIKLDKLSRTT